MCYCVNVSFIILKQYVLILSKKGRKNEFEWIRMNKNTHLCWKNSVRINTPFVHSPSSTGLKVINSTSSCTEKLLPRTFWKSSSHQVWYWHIKYSKYQWIAKYSIFPDLVVEREQQFICTKCYYVASSYSELMQHEMSC